MNPLSLSEEMSTRGVAVRWRGSFLNTIEGFPTHGPENNQHQSLSFDIGKLLHRLSLTTKEGRDTSFTVRINNK